MKEDRPEGTEYLVIDGRLDRSGHFDARRCRSTQRVREWPVIEESDVVVELLTADGTVLHREMARVTPELDCKPGDAERFAVLAYIGLREEASGVRLRRNDLTLWTVEIPPAPDVSIALPRGRPQRDRIYQLRLRFSEPYGKAHVMLVYKWGERRFQPIYTGPPAEVLEVDLATLPGGKSCRFVAEYSNGLRSAIDATKEFSVPLLGPALSIVSPAPKTRIGSGVPLGLEAQIIDQERLGGARPDQHLAWLVDGEEVGRGPIWSVDGLDVGARQVTVRYETDGDPVEATVEVHITRAQPDVAALWDDWDPTDDRFL